MLELKDLRLLQALNIHKTLTRTARALRQTQPALSRHLLILENKIGGQLFARKRSGSVPTDLGRVLLELGSEVIGKVEQINSTIEELRGRQSNEIAITVGFRVGDTFVAEVCSHLITEMPKTRLKVKFAEWTEVEKDILDRKSSIALVHMPGHSFDSSIKIEELDKHPSCFLVRPGHPLLSKKLPTIQEAMAFPLISPAQVPPDELLPIGEARRQAGGTSAIHPAFPSIINSSPAFGFKIIKKSNAVISSTVMAAIDELRQGSLAVLRLPVMQWSSLSPCILSLKAKDFSDAEKKLIAIIRAASRKARDEAISWCAENDVPVT
jgi:DNA-binding transcriptional LysR family regulator